jgi:hypothetical protein
VSPEETADRIEGLGDDLVPEGLAACQALIGVPGASASIARILQAIETRRGYRQLVVTAVRERPTAHAVLLVERMLELGTQRLGKTVLRDVLDETAARADIDPLARAAARGTQERAEIARASFDVSPFVGRPLAELAGALGGDFTLAGHDAEYLAAWFPARGVEVLVDLAHIIAPRP